MFENLDHALQCTMDTAIHGPKAESGNLVMGPSPNIASQFWPYIPLGHYFIASRVSRHYHTVGFIHNADPILAKGVANGMPYLGDKWATILIAGDHHIVAS